MGYMLSCLYESGEDVDIDILLSPFCYHMYFSAIRPMHVG